MWFFFRCFHTILYLVYKHLNDSCFEWYFEDLENSRFYLSFLSLWCTRKGISLSFKMKLKSFDLLYIYVSSFLPLTSFETSRFSAFCQVCALKNVGDTFLPISYCCVGGCESVSHSGNFSAFWDRLSWWSLWHLKR